LKPHQQLLQSHDIEGLVINDENRPALAGVFTPTHKRWFVGAYCLSVVFFPLVAGDGML
jgi:hypothetical protein